MRKRLPLFVLLFVLVAAAAAAAPPAGDEESPFALPEADPEAVSARLVTETEAVVPGVPLQAGVLLSMKPGWHTYWKNGGDAGLPTTIQWDLPEGWKAGPIQWPTPHRYVEGGELVTYGYGDRVLLLVALVPPDDLPAGAPIPLRARVDWLMCKELCIPGGADLEKELPVAEQAPVDPSLEALFAQARARLPRPASAYEGVDLAAYLSLNAVPPGQTAHAAFVVEGLPEGEATVTWFPAPPAELFLQEPLVEEGEGRLQVTVPLELADDAEPGGVVRLDGVLEVRQGEQEWFLSAPLAVPVAAEGQALTATHVEVFGAGEEDAAAPAHRRPLWSYLLLALVGGVILNIMPCVLPVLSLKVMGFVTHADRDRATVIRLSLVFAAGVLASFLTLATVVVVLQQAGELLGWGFQFQNPAFVVVMIAVVFGFGLSLFGLYEIIPPVGGGGQGGHGIYAEQFFNGVLATILATPCSAPFLGTALGFAFTQPAVVIVAIFLTIGVGLALPYVLLSLNPAWLRFVPRPGPWMERFKQFMGFLLMATAVWLLWVLGQQLGTDGVVAALWFLLVLGFALWLHGAYLSFSASVARRMVVWVLSVAVVAAGWHFFLAGPLSPEGRARAAQAASTGAHGSGEIDWVEFSPQRLEQEVQAGRTVFVDFTAAWCLTCKANEKAVIDTEEIRAALEELDVLPMVGDWTQRDPVISQVLRRYGRSGVPFYAVFPAHRLDDPIVLPEVITKPLLLEALRDAGPSRG